MSKTVYFISGIVVVALLSGILVLFVVRKGSVEPSEILPAMQPVAAPAPASAPTAPTHAAPQQVLSATITYTDSGFSPDTLTVKSGTNVTFVNQSSAPFWPASDVHPSHSVYDGTTLRQHCANLGPTTFDACKGIAPGVSWPFKFDKVGSWSYHDHLRGGFYGRVVVE